MVMGKKAAKLLKLLKATGHYDNPFGKDVTPDVSEEDKVARAVASYQSMYASELAPLIAKQYPERSSAEVKIDGVIGPALLKLAKRPRCECKDYDPVNDVQAAQGSGNWRGCHGVGDFHHAKVKLLNSPPNHLEPVFDKVWNNVVQAYGNMGLKLSLTTSTPNITVEFVRPTGSWIGLAIVGHGKGCGSTIWARFDKNYRPANTEREWATLMLHEFGHNCGLSHSRGGIMNSYLVKGLKPTWKGDPSERLLKQRFGGKPINSTPEPPKPEPPTTPPTPGTELTRFQHAGETLAVSLVKKHTGVDFI